MRRQGEQAAAVGPPEHFPQGFPLTSIPLIADRRSLSEYVSFASRGFPLRFCIPGAYRWGYSAQESKGRPEGAAGGESHSGDPLGPTSQGAQPGATVSTVRGDGGGIPLGHDATVQPLPGCSQQSAGKDAREATASAFCAKISPGCISGPEEAKESATRRKEGTPGEPMAAPDSDLIKVAPGIHPFVKVTARGMMVTLATKRP